MKKKNYAAFLCALLSLAPSIYTQLSSYNSGAPDGHTGSPGDGRSCARSFCHSSFSTSFVPDLIEMKTPIGMGYYTDSVYQVEINIKEVGISRFGFQASVQDGFGNQAGECLVHDPVNTIRINSDKYITHSEVGSLSDDSASWIFKWSPPQPGVGTVTIFAAVNVTNNDDEPTGDRVLLSSLAIPEASDNTTINTGISIEMEALNNIKFYINKVMGFIQIQGMEHSQIDLTISDIQGKTILYKSKLISNFVPLPKVCNQILIATIATPSGVRFSKKILIN